MKINRLFVDSNFFIALYNLDDSQHKKAVQVSKQLLADPAELIISNFVFSEIVTVLSQNVNRQNAIAAGSRLLLEEGRFANIDPKLMEKTWQIFKQINKKNVSFVDCSILAVMDYLDIKWLLTFDETDFKPLQKPFKFKLYPI